MGGRVGSTGVSTASRRASLLRRHTEDEREGNGNGKNMEITSLKLQDIHKPAILGIC